ncbi:MAG TPA: RluA family pseudouridine synthase [Pyrinomonadaceae bacterium]|nr:RluA family pseudouridine synthase [Pyrinomonadaceae bacterium]
MTKERFFEVGESAAGLRLDEFLAGQLHELSRMRIAALLRGGAAEVNGEAGRAGLRLRAGDRVRVEAGEAPPNAMTPEPLPLEVVHEDEHLAVVVKPAGMLMHPTRGVKTGTLANALAYRLGAGGVRPGLVHRLDRATSGLVVVAKTREAHARLSEHFRRRLVEKRYLALLRGEVEADELQIRAPVGREEGARPPWRVTEAGRPAETRLRVLGRRPGLTLVELEPVTGRTNQLRIHCAHVGHPIAGDEWHAADGLPRLCLHAARLAFNHPATNERMSFLSPLPVGVEAVWRGGG